MKNPSERISPSEIKKYVYCPYGWYYERLYGYKHIYGLHKKRLKSLGLEDFKQSGYIKGQKFHRQYRPFSVRRVIIQAAILIIVIYACACLLLK